MSDRRNFIKKAAGSAAAGITLTTSNLFQKNAIAEEKKPAAVIKYRQLGSTGYKVTEIGFGAMNTRDPELIHAAIDGGINYLDTAHGYMNGVNEEIIGSVMKTKRDKVFLTTKVRARNLDQLPGMMETSLKRLKVDHVDLFLLHVTSKRETILDEKIIKIFDDARKKGITRFVGVSTHSNQAEVLDAVVESKFWQAVLVGYNYFSPKNVTDSIKKSHEAGIAIIGMKNLLNPATEPWKPLDDIRKDKKSKMTPQQGLIRWVLDNPNVDTTIPGMTTFEHLTDDLAVMNMKLTLDDRRVVRKYAENLKGHYCLGLSGCTECVDKCPKGVAVNDINRCLGYANTYNDINLARENYDKLPASGKLDACSGCDTCTVKCYNGIDISGNILKAKELFA